MIDLQQLKKEGETLLVVTLSGKLTTKEYDVFRPHFESEIRHFTNLRLLFDMREFKGWQAGSPWRKVSFDSNHRTNIAKIAVVGSLWKKKWMERACAPLQYKNLRPFPSKKLDEAWAWLAESSSPWIGKV